MEYSFENSAIVWHESYSDSLPLNWEIEPWKEPLFVGFQCFICGERHAELRTVEECHEAKRFQMASAPVLIGEIVAA
jgi:hypothetical protein